MSKDPNITEFGGVKMTKKDEEKLKAAYGCSGCGGSHVGGGGEITFGNHDTDCEWLITVDDGSVIELSIKEFSVRLKSDIYHVPYAPLICYILPIPIDSEMRRGKPNHL